MNQTIHTNLKFCIPLEIVINKQIEVSQPYIIILNNIFS